VFYPQHCVCVCVCERVAILGTILHITDGDDY
jgi:hypothetical protein